MDDQQTQAVETASEETLAAASPTVDQKAAAEGQAEPTSAKVEEVQPEQKESNRLGRRFAQVAEKARQDERQRLGAAQPQTPSEDDDWTQYAQPSADVQRLAQEVAQLKQNLTAKERNDLIKDAERNFQDEARLIEERYPKYREGSSEFDQEAINEVWDLYKSNAEILALNPRAKVPSFSEFVDKFERQLARAAEHAKSQVTATSLQQASEAAIAPTAHSQVSKSFDQMTKAEKEAYLGVV